MINKREIPAFLLLFILIASIGTGLVQCGRAISEVGSFERGTLIVRTQFCEALQKMALTTFDSIVVEISGSDMGTAIHYSRKVTPGLLLIDTCPDIPAGPDRKVKIFTVDRAGDTIHIDSLKNRIVDIDQNTISTINATLIPAAGSIYLQLANVSTSVDSVFISFVSAGRTWKKGAKRALRMTVSLDNIPNGTKGVVYLKAVNSSGKILYEASADLTFDARKLSQLDLDFKMIPGQLAMNLTLLRPGITLMAINLGDQDAVNERGDLVITEVMFNEPDSFEYLEIYNPADTVVKIDTFIIDVDNNLKKFGGFSIAAHSFYVLGRKSKSWVDKVIEPKSIMDFSQTGNQIALRAKDSTVLDQIIISAGSLEWPNGTAKKAIILDSTKYNVLLNNFGCNWHLATAQMTGADSTLFGSPGKK